MSNGNSDVINRIVIPIRERRLDWILLIFFFINLTIVSYQADLEQLVIKDPFNFVYPIWPLPAVIDALHAYMKAFDPLLLARPVWYQMMVWVDQLFYGPFYAAAIYAFWTGREWIRNWCLLWSGCMLMTVISILGEEMWGEHATDHVFLVVSANLSWVIVPVFLSVRMWKEHPFTREVSKQQLNQP